MRRKDAYKKSASVVAAVIFVLSMFYAGSAVALPTSAEAANPLSYDIANSEDWQSYIAQDSEGGTSVWWRQDTNSSSDTWSWEHRNWLFGPSPTYEIFHENNAPFGDESYAQIGEKIKVEAVIPTSVFALGSELQSISFNGWYQTANWNFSADFGFGYNSWDGMEDWYSHSYQYNQSDEGGWDEMYNWIEIYSEECTHTSDDDAHYFTFIISFTADAPQGLYELNMWGNDDQGQSISTQNYMTGWEFRGIAVGIPPSEAYTYSYGGSYTLQKLDLDGDPVYSLSRGQDFVMRFNVAGQTPDWVSLGYQIPDGLEVPVNITGDHYELVTEYGGWVYNSTLETYVWDDTVPVTYMDYVFGTYESRQWIETGLSEDIKGYRLEWFWDEATQTEWYDVVYGDLYVYEQEMRYIYNSTSDDWETYYHYVYYEYPLDHFVDGIWEERVEVWESLTPEMPLYYEMNEPLCSVSTVGGDLVVDIVGHFTQMMPVSTENSYYNEFRPEVKGPGDEWNYYYPDTGGDFSRQTEAEFRLAKTITIEIPVTIARILRADGTEPRGWMLQIDKNDPFMVEGRLQGGGAIADDIDAVMFVMNGHSSYWTEEESRWSRVTYEIVLNMTGYPTVKAFNHTEKYNQTYGTYWDWQPVIVEGWYQYYNESTNTWEWAYGEHEEYQSVEVEGWHWTSWIYNQLSGKWQQEWFGDQSAQAAVSADFGETTDFTTWVEDDDLYVTFLVNMSDSSPDANYWWDFAFMNNTWFEDYSSEYGLHEVLSWEREFVYSFDIGAEKIYMDPFNANQLAFNSSALSPDYMLGSTTPYIVLDGKELAIKNIEHYEPWSGQTYQDLVLYRWDYENDVGMYYYLLKNGTEFRLDRDRIYRIYNVTTSGGDSFLTAMDYNYYWEYGGTSYYYWFDIYGNIHQGDYAEYGRYNVEFTEVDKLPAESEDWVYLYRFGLDQSLVIVDRRWSSMNQREFLTDIDGNLYESWYNPSTGWYEIEVDGVVYDRVDWWYLKVEQYGGQDAYFFEWRADEFWYHEKDGVKHEMPYPGANAHSEYDLDRDDVNGGVVPTKWWLELDGEVYPVYNISHDYYVDINSVPYLVNYTELVHSKANGTNIWDPSLTGWSANVGTFDSELRFNQRETIYYGDEFSWREPYNINDFYMFELHNGTTLNCSAVVLFLVHEYEVDGKTFYSTRTYPYSYWDEFTYEYFYYYEAINGSQIPVPDWNNLPVISSQLVYAYHNSTDWVFDFDGDTHPLASTGAQVAAYMLLNSSSSDQLFVNWQWPHDPHRIYNVSYEGGFYNATDSYENVYRLRERSGYALVYAPKPIVTQVHKNYYDFVVGVPEWGMWGMNNWDIAPENGALDLDGDFETTDDQYYVVEEYGSRDSWTYSWSNMDMHLTWDPNATLPGDEMNIHSWLGLNTYSWTYEWNQTFYWFDAETLEPLTSAEWDIVVDTVLTEEGEPRPGYWDIAWMTRNTTWEDILAEAEEMGWDWITSNEQTWTWMSFAVGQNYGTSYSEGDVEHWLGIGLHYEFSGLMIWEDMNEDLTMQVDMENPGGSELTHYLIPDYVDSVSFVSPGEAFGNTDSEGFIEVDVEDEVTWGVSFYDINGTTFPFTSYGYWGWYDGVVAGSDMRTFDERPTKVTIDEISFLVHFQGYLNETDPLNNYADVKVDNYVGNWDVDMIGGRDNLENRSLALNYFADVNMQDFAFKADGMATTQEMIVSAATFEMATVNAKFAEMIMGGNQYDWSKNETAPFNVTSYTTPAGTFRAAYQSESGHSAAAWSWSSTQFYVSIGFPEWDGYSVFQDPVFVAYVSSTGSTEGPPTTVDFGTFSISPEVPQATDTVVVSVDVYSGEEIYQVELSYSTDLGTLGESWSGMSPAGPVTWTGEIPPHDLGVQIYFKIRALTESGWAESGIGSYIVGQGVITTGPPDGGPGLGTDALVMIVGVLGVVVILFAMLRRRRR
ncbi:MAG: hypothetical protein JSW61_03665 [Candidatus Thorarchaeota archaeon]|nr:MAG: hypothetical protein JSW61_03665 [Candidatus Thorarchaeota archaeon]